MARALPRTAGQSGSDDIQSEKHGDCEYQGRCGIHLDDVPSCWLD